MPTGGGGGGGGGSGTVTTDGVTIQGNGSGGSPIALLAVSTQPRLTGAGISSSKLDIAGLPLSFTTIAQFGGNNPRGGGNQVSISGFVLPSSVTFSHITVLIPVADAVGLYDMGIYTAAGALVANIGAQTLPSTGLQTFATVQGAQTIPPGLYAFGWTGNAATANLAFDPDGIFWVFNQNVAASSGGTLPNSVGALSVSPSVNGWQFNIH